MKEYGDAASSQTQTMKMNVCVCIIVFTTMYVSDVFASGQLVSMMPMGTFKDYGTLMGPKAQQSSPSKVEMSPFIQHIPKGIAKNCNCVAVGDCGCCLDFSIRPNSVKSNVCINATLTTDVEMESNYWIRIRVFLDKLRLAELSVSRHQSPKACFSLISFGVAACVGLNELYRDAENRHCGCATFSIQWRENYFTEIPTGCVCFADTEKQRSSHLNIFRPFQ